ncbi:MAG: nuclear transport factor 2 family protein [Gammaproteobacteria bacterium]|nr:nuclear transport factor 2 family protein [Gammaproteobacteria bacterium]
MKSRWLIMGCGALVCLALVTLYVPQVQSAGTQDLEARVRNLEQALLAVQLQATRAQDVLDIMSLQARYEAIHSSQESLAWMLFAPRADSTLEITHSRIVGFENIRLQYTDPRKLMELYKSGKLPAGTHLHEIKLSAQAGSFGPPLAGGGPPDWVRKQIGEGGPRRLYGKGPGMVPPIHPISTPNIIVAGDGKTAKATFTSLGYERGGWCYGKYANDYIKIDGRWYIWHEKWLRGFSSNYYESPDDQKIDQIFEWTADRDANGFPVIARELTAQYLWYPGKENMTITAPRPYPTWTREDDNGNWWKRPTTEP